MTAQIFANQPSQDCGVAAKTVAVDCVVGESQDVEKVTVEESQTVASAPEKDNAQDSQTSDNASADGSDKESEENRPGPASAVPSVISSSLDILGLPEFDPVVEAQTYDAVRWIPIIGDTYSLGRAAYFALDGNLQEAGICAVSAIPFVGNTLATAKRVKDAKDANGANPDTMGADGTAGPKQAPLPPVYNKLISWFDSFMGNETQPAAQNENENENQEQNQAEKGASSCDLPEEIDAEASHAKHTNERRLSMNDFGDEDPVKELSLHPHEASADVLSTVDVKTASLDEKEDMRRLSSTSFPDPATLPRKFSGSNTVYISGAGMVPVMPQ